MIKLHRNNSYFIVNSMAIKLVYPTVWGSKIYLDNEEISSLDCDETPDQVKDLVLAWLDTYPV